MSEHAPLDQRRIDLHAHSRVSDGTQSPADLIAAGIDAGLDVLAITDHDSTAGWSSAFAAAEGSGLEVVGGIELSTQLDYASVHVLGYWPDPQNAALVAVMDETRAERLTRAESMVARISADYPVTWDDVMAEAAQGATVGRPHIADALVTAGIVADRSAAFEGILHWRGGYYRPHRAPLPWHGVQLLAEAGAAPVIAHPGARGPAHLWDDERITRLVDAGLAGIEVNHRDNPPESRVRWREIARRFGLAVTGSSDYHGAGKPNRLGENLTEPVEFDDLRRRAR